ncbi:MAG: diguanylate cyclase [Planctomycetes bacterium]|nr:diguanylate cyclase [Planctomycetota bacterium]
MPDLPTPFPAADVAGAKAADPTMRDIATGLRNRHALLTALRERVPTNQGALLLLDLDGFRAATQGLETPVVDRLLREVAGRLHGAYPPEAVLYRYARDAFALLILEVDRDRGAATAEALRAAVAREPFHVRDAPGSRAIPLTAGVGSAVFPIDGRTPASVVEAAERALLVAKRLGRDRIAVAGRLDPAALAEIGIYRGLPCPVFIGRVAEQSRLRQLATDVRHVGPKQVFISGGPGTGKSRLVHELSLWARGEKHLVLSAICRESRANAPYSTLVEQIETLLVTDRFRALPALERLGKLHRAALAVVLRDLPAAWSAVKIDPAKAGQIIFEAFGALLDELAETGPLLIVADEAEHVDEATLEAYRGAIQRRLPCLIAAISERDVTELDRFRIANFFREFESSAIHLKLHPLGGEDIRQMLKAILPDADISPEDLERLVEAAGGNALYVEETVRSLLLRGRLRLSEGRWALPRLDPRDLSRDLEGASRSVTAALPKGAESLLTRAAVIGPRVDPDLLQEVLGYGDIEILDLIDEVRRARMLLPSESGEEELAFPAAHARRIRLQTADPAERKEIHERVGVVQESRHGGDVAHLADELAYHFGKAGNETKAREFDALARRQAALIRPPVKEGVRRPRIEAVTQPLAPAALEHALATLGHFATALRIARLYPQWSQIGSAALAQLRASLDALVASAPGLTVSVTPKGPLLNGQPCGASVAADFAELLDDRLIESLTIRAGFDTARIEALIRAFVEPFDRARAAPDLWDRFLTREGYEALDIVQKAYEARETERQTGAPAELPVPPDQLSGVRDALRSLKAAVDNLKLYPPSHPAVEESAAQAARQMVDLISRVPALTLGTADGELVINGLPADRKFFGESVGFLIREIEQKKLVSISFWRGLREDEVRALISLLSLAPGDSAKESLQDQFIRIALGSRRYQRAEEGALKVDLKPPPKPVRSELRAREFLARPYDKFLALDLEYQFPMLVEALAYGAGRPLAEQLVDRLGLHFHDASLSHRSRAYNLLARSLAAASPGTRKVEISRSLPPLKQRLSADMSPPHFRAAANIMPLWVPAAATAGCLRELADIAGGTLRARADLPSTPREIAAVCEATLQLIPQSRVFEGLCASLRRPNEEERRAAVKVLMAVGGSALEKLVEFLADEQDVNARRTIAASLSPVAEKLSHLIIRLLDEASPLDRLSRVLEVSEFLVCPPITAHLAGLAERGSPEARQKTLRAAEKWPRAAALQIVKRLLASPAADVRDAGLEAAARLKVDAVGHEVGKILDETKEERIMTLCCRYFAAVPNPVVIPLLLRIIQKRPRFFGLIRGFAAETRAAAVVALEAHNSPQAQGEAARALADDAVRRIAEHLRGRPASAAAPSETSEAASQAPRNAS